MLPEFNLIERYFKRAGHSPDSNNNSVITGIGDDAAVISPAADAELVIATDAIVEGVHFPVYTPAHAVGYRALAVNLSDLAAMGAKPRWANLALSLPEPSEEWVEQFAAGFFSLADAYGIALIGGDTVSGPLMASVTLQGEVAKGQSVLRSGANDGDGIYVTGHPGDAVAGRLCDGTGKADHYLADCFLYPVPRVKEGMQLGSVASAMIDVSDGLNADLTHLLHASGVGAELDVSALPVSSELLASVGEEQAIAMALTGGDDYELCFTVADENEPALQDLSASWDCPVTRIGTVVAAAGVTWRQLGDVYEVAAGFDHFSGAYDDS